MIEVLRNRVFARLFAAQVIALIGTGLLTVALGLLAYDLAGARAGVVLGGALTLKMVAYVGLAPVAGALVGRWPRKAVLVAADLVRAGIALSLPFVGEVWQVYVLIFVLQAASATFTPAFQALIPDVLPQERAYTRALSLSRLAYDIENVASPALAGLLLSVMSYHGLFLGTVAGFAGSAMLVLSVGLPPVGGGVARPFRERLLRGVRIYLATPRLRGLLALSLAAAAVSAFVLVNSVVIVRGVFGGSAAGLALAMGCYGAGSMAAALALPGVLDRVSDRRVMMLAARALAVVTVVAGGAIAIAGWPGWGLFCLLWVVLGALYSAVLTPSGRLLRRSAHAEDRAAVFTAQFALSHACWLITYPLAGWAGAGVGLAVTLAGMGVLAGLAVLLAGRVWPVGGDAPLVHQHPDLPPDHPHLQGGSGGTHTHAVVIDDAHRVWPTRG